MPKRSGILFTRNDVASAKLCKRVSVQGLEFGEIFCRGDYSRFCDYCSRAGTGTVYLVLA